MPESPTAPYRAPMISSVEFHNFKVLRDAKLPLGPFTLLIGANGSGKSTALQGLQAVGHQNISYREAVSVGAESSDVSVSVHWNPPFESHVTRRTWHGDRGDSAALRFARLETR